MRTATFSLTERGERAQTVLGLLSQWLCTSADWFVYKHIAREQNERSGCSTEVIRKEDYCNECGLTWRALPPVFLPTTVRDPPKICPPLAGWQTQNGTPVCKTNSCTVVLPSHLWCWPPARLCNLHLLVCVYVYFKQCMNIFFVHKVSWQGTGVVFTLCFFTFNPDPSASILTKCLL